MPYKGTERDLLGWLAKAQYGDQVALDEFTPEDYDTMADNVVAAALDGDFRAIQEIAWAIDE